MCNTMILLSYSCASLFWSQLTSYIVFSFWRGMHVGIGRLSCFVLLSLPLLSSGSSLSISLQHTKRWEAWRSHQQCTEANYIRFTHSPNTDIYTYSCCTHSTQRQQSEIWETEPSTSSVVKLGGSPLLEQIPFCLVMITTSAHCLLLLFMPPHILVPFGLCHSDSKLGDSSCAKDLWDSTHFVLWNSALIYSEISSKLNMKVQCAQKMLGGFRGFSKSSIGKGRCKP